MSLRWRIASLLAVVSLAVGAFSAAASYLSTGSQLRASIDTSLRTAATTVNGSQGDGGRGHDGEDDGDCPVAALFASASAAQLVSTSGVVSTCIEGGPQLPVTAAERSLSSGAVELRTVRIEGRSYRLLSTAWHAGGVLQIARSTEESEGVLDRLRLLLLLLVLAATAVAAVLGWVIATRLVRPIARLRDSAHHIATTLDLSTDVAVDGPGEVGSLAVSFATMVGAVAASQEQQRRLVADASHEMRTPLTSLRSNTELLGRIEKLAPAERAEVVRDVLDDVDELSALLSELVDLASDLKGAEAEESVHLGDLARTVAARVGRRTGRTVTVVETAATTLSGRPRQLERAINNLVDNAVKYSDDSAVVDLLVHGVTVVVRDRGRGIAEPDLARVFDRFYRAVDVRSQPGSGLGLSIVDEIVRSHGGTVFARAREDGRGSEVGFDLG